MRNILIISILLFVFSCKSSFNKKKFDTTKKSDVVLKNYFSNQDQDFLYKTTIDIYGNQLGGIFVIKKINAQDFRCVLTTEFGNKLIDLKVSENSFEKIFAVQDLDRKIVIETLAYDLQCLLFLNNNLYLQAENENEYELVGIKKQEYIIYKTEKNGYVSEINTFEESKEKVIFKIQRENSEMAQKIEIVHKNIKLIINLNLFIQ